MSRLAKKPIAIPAGVTTSMANDVLTIKGKNGERSMTIPNSVKLDFAEGQMTVIPALTGKEASQRFADTGMVWAMARNMVTGVSDGFTRTLEFTGVGYTAQVAGSTLKMTLGFSHPIEIEIPIGLSVKVEKNSIAISGNDKEQIGQWAATIRKIRPPEPYKGKGIRYSDEVILRKEGKKAGTAA